MHSVRDDDLMLNWLFENYILYWSYIIDLLSHYQNPLFMGGNCFAMKHQSIIHLALFSHTF